MHYITFHFFPAAPSSSSASSFSVFSPLLHLLFLPTLHFLFFSLFYICSLSFFDLQDTVTFLTRYLYPLPPSCTSSPPLIPHHLLLPSSLHRSASYLLLFFTLHFFSFCFLQLFPSFCVSSAHVDPSLAECSVGNRHLGRRISISPLACWDRFSKNTAKSYLTTYACGSAGVHKHTLSLFCFLLCVCVCITVYIPAMLACQIWSYPLSAISPRIATLIPFSLAGS